MAKEVNLNSSDWCDLIFEGKNKKYGAYFLRQTSSKRHIVAFFVVVLFTAAVSALPLLVEFVNQQKELLGGVNEAFEMSDLDKAEQELPQEDIIKQEMAPPPPPLKASIQFTPPVITADENVNEDNQMKSQEELNESKVTVASQTIVGVDSPDAVNVDDLKDHKVITATKEEEKPFVSVEQMPQFQGGTAELMKYIGANLRYPTIAAENGIEGRVIIRFVVGKDGSVSGIEVQRGLDASCDKEARRVVESMPKWVPGKQNGRPVAVYFTLPILFKLQK